MSTTAPKTVDGSRPYCWEVADETRRLIATDCNGLRRAANRAVGTVVAIAGSFPSGSADRRMVEKIAESVEVLHVLAFGWKPLSTTSADAITEGLDGAVEPSEFHESVYSDRYFRAVLCGQVYILRRETCCAECPDKFVVVMEAGK